MATAQQEAAERAAAKAKRSRKFVYQPVLFDRMNVGRDVLDAGTVVVKVQPYGCPKNGTMGMCYVGDPVTGERIAMVMVNSLIPKGR